jgi:hypothetical protein
LSSRTPSAARQAGESAARTGGAVPGPAEAVSAVLSGRFDRDNGAADSFGYDSRTPYSDDAITPVIGPAHPDPTHADTGAEAVPAGLRRKRSMRLTREEWLTLRHLLEVSKSTPAASPAIPGVTKTEQHDEDVREAAYQLTRRLLDGEGAWSVPSPGGAVIASTPQRTNEPSEPQRHLGAPA